MLQHSKETQISAMRWCSREAPLLYGFGYRVDENGSTAQRRHILNRAVGTDDRANANRAADAGALEYVGICRQHFLYPS